MNLSVPKPCFDTPFHLKWREAMIAGANEHIALYLSREAKDALKKFLAHPASLPKEEEKIASFLTNSMIITEKWVMDEVLQFLASIRYKFDAGFEGVDKEPASESSGVGVASSDGLSVEKLSIRSASPPPRCCQKCQTPFSALEVILDGVPLAIDETVVVRLVERATGVRPVVTKPLTRHADSVAFLMLAGDRGDLLTIVNAEDDILKELASLGAPAEVTPRLYLTKDACRFLGNVAAVYTEEYVFTEKTKKRFIQVLPDFVTLLATNFFADMSGLLVVCGHPLDVRKLRKNVEVFKTKDDKLHLAIVEDWS